jgi:hypothetical protein
MDAIARTSLDEDQPTDRALPDERSIDLLFQVTRTADDFASR